jgi:hypothetical protein
VKLRIAYTIAIVIENATIETTIALSPNSPVITDWNALAASSTPSLPKDCEFLEKKASIYEMISPNDTDTIDVGPPKSPIAKGITYGICIKKNSGVKRTASVSLGENLKYNRNISTNTISAKSAHSEDSSKRCPVINNAAINTMQLGVRIEHSSDAIRTITKFLRLSIYPNLLFIMQIVISAKRNFHA